MSYILFYCRHIVKLRFTILFVLNIYIEQKKSLVFWASLLLWHAINRLGWFRFDFLLLVRKNIAIFNFAHLTVKCFKNCFQLLLILRPFGFELLVLNLNWLACWLWQRLSLKSGFILLYFFFKAGLPGVVNRWLFRPQWLNLRF